MELSRCLTQQVQRKNWTPLKGTLAALTALTGHLDPHSYFLSPEAYRRFYEDHLGAFGGLGMHMAAFPEGVTVFAVAPNSPAARGGVMTGDLLIKVDDQNVSTTTAHHLSDTVRGEPGTPVTLELKRQGQSSPLRLTLIREALEQNSLTGTCPMPRAATIAYLQLSTFSSRSTEELRKALSGSATQGAILDLRGNSGGSLQAARDICNLFLPQSSEVVRIQTRHGEETLVCGHPPAFPTLPLAILTDQDSASASEIVAAALQAHHRATLFGERTWGKALVQTVWPIRSHCGLGLTTGHYLSPGGRELQRPYPVMDEYLYFLPPGYGQDRSGPGGVLPDIPITSSPLPEWAFKIRRQGMLFHALLPLVRAPRATCPQGPRLVRLLKDHLPTPLTPADLGLLEALARHEWFGMLSQTGPATQALLEWDAVADRAARYLLESSNQTPHPSKETRS